MVFYFGCYCTEKINKINKTSYFLNGWNVSCHNLPSRSNRNHNTNYSQQRVLSECFHISKSSSSISAFFFTDIDVKTGMSGNLLSSSVSTGTVWPVLIQFNIVRLICALFVILFFWSIFTFRRFSLSSRHIFERPPIRDGFFGFGDDVFWSFCT